MKYHSLIFLLFATAVKGQGTFIYDQQSRTNQTPGSGFPIGFEQPMGQSFTPTLTSVGFAQFELDDFSGSVGGTVFVKLWSGSLATGTLLGSTAPVFVPNGAFDQITTFLFSTPVTVSSGTTYYFQPILQSGDTTTMMIIAANTYNYSGGTLYWNGTPDPNGNDAWFREGIVAPEPSFMSLILLGSGILLYVRTRNHKPKAS